jgi:hypothetical protein
LPPLPIPYVKCLAFMTIENLFKKRLQPLLIWSTDAAISYDPGFGL